MNVKASEVRKLQIMRLCNTRRLLEIRVRLTILV
jgi:hypothetical protein